jgi:hypothetical protein
MKDASGRFKGGTGFDSSWPRPRRGHVLELSGTVLLVVGLVLVQSQPVTAAPEDEKNVAASALLQVARSAPTVLTDGRHEARMDAAEFSSFKQTQAEWIKSRVVLNSALRDPNVQKIGILKEQADAISLLKSNLRVEFSGDTELLRVSISSMRPQEAAVLINAIVDAYMREIVNRERNQKLLRLDKLKGIYIKYQDSLKIKRVQLRELTSATHSDDPQTTSKKKQLLMEELSACRRESLGVRLEKVALEVRLERRKSLKDSSEESRKAIAVIEEDLAVHTAKQKVLEKEQERVIEESRSLGHDVVDLESQRDEIEHAKATAKQVGAEIERLTVELQAPVGIQVIERAEVGK